jgi:hypothetical protein
MSFLLTFKVFLQQNQRRGMNGFCLEAGVAQTIYTHVSKYKNNEIKREKKEELNKDMENLRRKNQTETLGIKSPYGQTKNTVEGHSSRLEKVKNRPLEFKDKIEIEEKKKKS